MVSDSAQEAVERAKQAALIARKRAQASLLRRPSGESSLFFAKAVGKSGQVVIPKDVLDRWRRKDRTDTADPYELIALDLGWGLLLMPRHEAAALAADSSLTDLLGDG